jgi:hypothetical protein
MAVFNQEKPLKPEDFPVNADGKKITKQDGTPIAETEEPAVAADVADRLNEDEARREKTSGRPDLRLSQDLAITRMPEADGRSRLCRASRDSPGEFGSKQEYLRAVVCP